MHRSELTVDRGAIRRNVATLKQVLGDAELWAVVKADGYGHGARDAAGAAIAAGAEALCVVTVGEALELRQAFGSTRILVLGPWTPEELPAAREAALELISGDGELPEDIPVHVKLDTGMGRWGLSELATPARTVVGLMTHLATADTDVSFALEQLARFRTATEPYAHLTRHAANSAAALRIPESHFDAARCGVAVYGLSPFGTDPADDELVPALRWTSYLAQVKLVRAGQSTGYGRRFVAERDTWIGIVPVGYADGFRRDLTGTEVRVAGERCRVVGAVSMDAFSIELPRELPRWTPVTIIGSDLLVEEHARVAGTINYELTSRIESSPTRARRTVL
jgi:alanine racemase